jgi:hypothetical protein
MFFYTLSGFIGGSGGGSGGGGGGLPAGIKDESIFWTSLKPHQG